MGHQRRIRLTPTATTTIALQSPRETNWGTQARPCDSGSINENGSCGLVIVRGSGELYGGSRLGRSRPSTLRRLQPARQTLVDRHWDRLHQQIGGSLRVPPVPTRAAPEISDRHGLAMSPSTACLGPPVRDTVYQRRDDS